MALTLKWVKITASKLKVQPMHAWHSTNSDSQEPYIIAEAGVNHNGDINKGYALIEIAKHAGADCVKFQAFTADDLVTKDAQKADYQMQGNPTEQSQHEMLKHLEFSIETFAKLKKYSEQIGIDFLTTPFSPYWVDQLACIGATTFKIGSGSIGQTNLLTAIGNTKCPVIISSGMADLADTTNAITHLRNAGTTQIAVLHCVSLYPTRVDQINLRAITTLKNHLQIPVGFSDHTMEQSTGALAVIAGATILEKHFTTDQSLPGPDHQMSQSPGQLKTYITNARQAREALGTGLKKMHPDEIKIKAAATTSVVSTTTIPKGTIITQKMVTAKRPGTGIPSNQIDSVIGKKTNQKIAQDQLILNNHLI